MLMANDETRRLPRRSIIIVDDDAEHCDHNESVLLIPTPRSTDCEQSNEERMELEGVLAELRGSFESGRTRSLSWRQSQLRALSDILHKEEEGIFQALKADLGKHRAETYRDEVGASIKSSNHALKNVKGWMAPTKAAVPKVAFPASAEVVPEPLGVVLIFSSWNFPIGWYKVLILVSSFQALVEMETIRRARRRSTCISIIRH